MYAPRAPAETRNPIFHRCIIYLQKFTIAEGEIAASLTSLIHTERNVRGSGQKEAQHYSRTSFSNRSGYRDLLYSVDDYAASSILFYLLHDSFR